MLRAPCSVLTPRKYADSPGPSRWESEVYLAYGGPHARVSSPRTGCSILMTSALRDLSVSGPRSWAKREVEDELTQDHLGFGYNTAGGDFSNSAKLLAARKGTLSTHPGQNPGHVKHPASLQRQLPGSSGRPAQNARLGMPLAAYLQTFWYAPCTSQNLCRHLQSSVPIWQRCREGHETCTNVRGGPGGGDSGWLGASGCGKPRSTTGAVQKPWNSAFPARSAGAGLGMYSGKEVGTGHRCFRAYHNPSKRQS